MIYKYRFGTPFETDAVVADIPDESAPFSFGTLSLEEGFTYTASMEDDTALYGLGENLHGINKRGHVYVSNNTDDPFHMENKVSLYAAHNFLIITGSSPIGLFFDYPSTLTFDLGFTKADEIRIHCDRADLYVYAITGESPYEIAKEFRRIIGRSYIPPKYAFGFGQSRWGYKTAQDFRDVAAGYRDHHIPLDMIYMDIDYMDHYKDFTVNPEEFPDFPGYVASMKEDNIHLIPIIDAGVKIEKGYPVYEEGVEKGYFCKRADGSDFPAAVWPGRTHFPDVLNPDARKWFGDWYQVLVDAGIDGFWNDMNEPAIFYTDEGIEEAKETMSRFVNAADQEDSIFDWTGVTLSLNNRPVDYTRFFHNVDGKLVRHSDVHNLFGYNMTRAASESLDTMSENRMLLFSRSSYIGMHRYGGIWMGDNRSWWSHLLLNLKMLPSLNMCGFLYTGADLGGFSDDTSRDLLLRWLALGVFTPLMRNHTSLGTRDQECYRFEHIEDFRHVISVRYRLIPYLYSEYMKAALQDDLLFRPLAFDYPADPIACQIEDQLMLGHECMIAPVYTQNVTGRVVYLPEEMLFVKFLPDGSLSREVLPKGHHYVNIALNEVPLFIRKDTCIPLAKPAESVAQLDESDLTMIGYTGSSYELYQDDGLTKDYDASLTLEIKM